MKAIRIEAYMESASFTMKGWRGARRELTYPLPPYSTVIGMVHNLCGWDSYHAMDVSVSGSYIPPHSSIEMRWQGGCFAKTETEDFKKRFPIRIKTDKGCVGWVNTPIHVEELNDITLILHILPKSQEDISTIYQSLSYPAVYPSLGRHCDLLRIDNINIVDIDTSLQEVETSFFTYAPCENTDIHGTSFDIHKNYTIINKRRVFNNVRVTLLPAGIKVSAFTDTDGFPVFLA